MTRLGVAAALVDGVLVPGDVQLADGLVAAVGLPPVRGGGTAVPGLVDLQVNGYGGVDLLTSSADEWREASRRMARDGVTSFVANLVTAAEEMTASALAVAGEVAASPVDGTLPVDGASAVDVGARCLGAHLEGPFLAESRRGTHPVGHLRAPDRSALREWIARGPVVGMTIAPELPGALDVIGLAASSGVLVSLGHSDATAAEANAGFDAGARAVTHVFNGMSGVGSRRPGLAGVALGRADVAVQAIFDGVHLAPETASLVVAAAGSRLVLVTDALSATGAPDGMYRLGDVELLMVDGAARNTDGGLAGSVTPLVGMVRQAMALGQPFEQAVTGASVRPAELVGRHDLGRLRPGDRADVTVLDDRVEVTGCWVDGVPVD